MSGESNRSAKANAGKAAGPAPKAVEKLLAVARRLFYADGIRAVGVDEIVRAAGVTKPSLYRSFASKDALAATYLQGYEAEFWDRFEAAIAEHPGDARAQILAFLSGVAARAARPGHRGCALTNAAVEFPDAGNAARGVCEENKRDLRRRLHAKAAEMGASDPVSLGDGLFLLFEGANASCHLFCEDRPSGALAAAAELLIDASLRRS